jgi:hypothetical protein
MNLLSVVMLKVAFQPPITGQQVLLVIMVVCIYYFIDCHTVILPSWQYPAQNQGALTTFNAKLDMMQNNSNVQAEVVPIHWNLLFQGCS